MKAVEVDIDDYPLGLTRLPDGREITKYLRDASIGKWIPETFLTGLVHSELWHRRALVDHETSWPLSSYSALEILRNNPMRGNSAPAIERLLTRHEIKAVAEELERYGEEAFVSLLNGILDALAHGLSREPARKSEIKGHLADIERHSRELAYALRKLERKSLDYEGLSSLTSTSALLGKTWGFQPLLGKTFTDEEHRDWTFKNKNRLSTFVSTLAEQAAAGGKNLRLRDHYRSSNKDGHIVPGSLQRRIKALIIEIYGKPHNALAATLVNVLLDLKGNDLVTEEDMKHVTIPAR